MEENGRCLVLFFQEPSAFTVFSPCIMYKSNKNIYQLGQEVQHSMSHNIGAHSSPSLTFCSFARPTTTLVRAINYIYCSIAPAQTENNAPLRFLSMKKQRPEKYQARPVRRVSLVSRDHTNITLSHSFCHSL